MYAYGSHKIDGASKMSHELTIVPVRGRKGLGQRPAIASMGAAREASYAALRLNTREGMAPAMTFFASEAATSLENSRLYRELVEREAKIRCLIDANIIGIFIWELEGRILEANNAFLQTVGYDREDIVSGRLRWTELTPTEWSDSDARAVAEMKMVGIVQPFEKEYLRKDGSRVPVLIGVAAFDQRRNQGVAFVRDLTERKRAEAEAREIERGYREVQVELAHANRAATMGQLTASIAHEVNQPIAATVTNADAALRWLDCRSPNLDEVRQALARIVKDGHPASNVIGRIRALIKKAPPRKDRLEINEAIREAIEFTRGEAVKNGVSVQTQLAACRSLKEIGSSCNK
jgi:PAS domain S-box-containing protein